MCGQPIDALGPSWNHRTHILTQPWLSPSTFFHPASTLTIRSKKKRHALPIHMFITFLTHMHRTYVRTGAAGRSADRNGDGTRKRQRCKSAVRHESLVMELMTVLPMFTVMLLPWSSNEYKSEEIVSLLSTISKQTSTRRTASQSSRLYIFL